MRIIFLDIDGVLAVNHQQRDNYGSLFHDDFVNNLKSIIDNTNAKIVISSTWRRSGLERCQEMWKYRNLPGEIVGITPYLQFASKMSERINSVPRGCEIEHYLTRKGFLRINWSKEKQLEYLQLSDIKNYLILDDDSDMLYTQKEHYVQCSLQKCADAIEGYGLTKSVAEKGICILNSNLITLYYC